MYNLALKSVFLARTIFLIDHLRLDERVVYWEEDLQKYVEENLVNLSEMVSAVTKRLF